MREWRALHMRYITTVCNKMPLLVEMGAGWCTFAEEGVEKLDKNAKCTVHLQIREA